MDPSQLNALTRPRDRHILKTKLFLLINLNYPVYLFQIKSIQSFDSNQILARHPQFQ